MVTGISGGMPDPSTIWQSLLSKADQNKDGKISKDEFTAAMPQNAGGSSADDLFKQIDTNNDGFIDQAEGQAAAKKMHGHRHSHMPDPSEMFEKADKDGDGKISLDEFKAAFPQDGNGPNPEDIFKQIDTNGDGFIDKAENEAAMKQMAQKMNAQQESFSSLA